MLDMSWGELMVIGGVALVVIGPKDLPKALRTVGQMTTKVRRLAGEFQAQFNEAMREAELEDVRKEIEGINRSVASAGSTAFNPIQTIRDEIKGAVEHKASASTSVAVAPDGMSVEPLPEPIGPFPPVVEETGPTHQIELSPEPAIHPVEPLPPVQPDITGPGLETAMPEPGPRLDLSGHRQVPA